LINFLLSIYLYRIIYVMTLFMLRRVRNCRSYYYYYYYY